MVPDLRLTSPRSPIPLHPPWVPRDRRADMARLGAGARRREGKGTREVAHHSLARRRAQPTGDFRPEAGDEHRGRLAGTRHRRKGRATRERLRTTRRPDAARRARSFSHELRGRPRTRHLHPEDRLPPRRDHHARLPRRDRLPRAARRGRRNPATRLDPAGAVAGARRAARRGVRRVQDVRPRREGAGRDAACSSRAVRTAPQGSGGGRGGVRPGPRGACRGDRPPRHDGTRAG